MCSMSIECGCNFHQREKLTEEKLIGLSEMAVRHLQHSLVMAKKLEADTIDYEAIKDEMIAVAKGLDLMYTIVTGSSIKSKLFKEKETLDFIKMMDREMKKKI